MTYKDSQHLEEAYQSINLSSLLTESSLTKIYVILLPVGGSVVAVIEGGMLLGAVKTTDSDAVVQAAKIGRQGAEVQEIERDQLRNSLGMDMYKQLVSEVPEMQNTQSRR